MANYYPSEIARLVLGYLEEVQCPTAYQAFLEECPDLQEHYRLLRSGIACTTDMEGKSLREILHEYRISKAAERNKRNEASSNHRNANTSNSEVFKTPSKSNADALNRFRVNQKTQSQATASSLRFGEAAGQSPQITRSFVSTPSRVSVPRTPRRLQGIHVTSLNFGADTDRNEGSLYQRGSTESTKQNVSGTQQFKETIVTKRSCFSDPVRRKPQMLSRMVQTETVTNTVGPNVNNTSCQTLLNLPANQGCVPNTSNENTRHFRNSNNVNRHVENAQSNADFMSSSNSMEVEQNLNNSKTLSQEKNEVDFVSRQSTLVNQKSIVFRSAEVRTGEDNFLFTSMESSVTPQNELDAPSYARAPNTNSPRLILSYDRSQLTSLTTPMKDKNKWNEEFASPRRKGTLPRRRLLSESPRAKQLAANEYALGVLHEDLEAIVEELIANPPLAQRLADNINKVICNEEQLRDPEASNSCSYPSLQDIHSSGELIQNILARTETDPAFNDMFFFPHNSRDFDDMNSTQESATDTVFPIMEGDKRNMLAITASLGPVIEEASSEEAFEPSKQSNTATTEQIQTPSHPTIDDVTDFPMSGQVNSQSCESASDQHGASNISVSVQVNPLNCESALSETKSIVSDKENPLNCEPTSNQNAGSSFTSADQVNLPNCESTQNQNVASTPNIEITEPMQVDDSAKSFTNVSTPTSHPKDVLDSCMSIIRPDSVDELQDCSYEQNIFNNENNLQSSTSNINENSTLVPVSATGNKTVPEEETTLKSVSIGTPFQVETQMAVNQNVSNLDNSVPKTSQPPLCSTSTSGVSSTVPLHQGACNSNVVILPPVENTSNIYQTFNPSLPATIVLPLPSGQNILMQSSNAFPYQNNLQYKIILPCGSKNCTNVTRNIVPVQTVPAENVLETSPILNSSPIKIPHDYSPTKAFMLKDGVATSDNVGNFVTVATVDNAQSKKKAIKKRKVTKEIPPFKKPPEIKKKRAKRFPKKQRRNLFSPQTNDTDVSDSEVIDDLPPVLSIPDPSPQKNESLSAMELLSNITENKNAQSPILKAMISSAKILAEKGGRLNSTHVRSLEFSSPCSGVDEENNQETLKLKSSKNVSCISGTRSSPRLKQKTACKSPSCSPSSSSKGISAKKKGTKICPSKEKSDVVATNQLNANKIVSTASMPDAMQITSHLEPSCKTPAQSPVKSLQNKNEKKRLASKCTTRRKVSVTADLVDDTIEQLNTHHVVSSKAADAVLNAIQEALHSSPLPSKNQGPSDMHKVHEMLKYAGNDIDLVESPIKNTPLKHSASASKVAMMSKQFFPTSLTDSGSSSDDLLPLSAIISSYNKETQRNSVKSKSKALEDPTNATGMEKNSSVADKRFHRANKLHRNKALSHKGLEISEGANASVKTSEPQHQSSNNVLDQSAVSSCVTLSAVDALGKKSDLPLDLQKKGTKKTRPRNTKNSSRRYKSRTLDRCKKRCLEKDNSFGKDDKKPVVMDLPETGLSACDPIVLESDEEIRADEKIAPPPVSETQGKIHPSKKNTPQKADRRKSPGKETSSLKEKELVTEHSSQNIKNPIVFGSLEYVDVVDDNHPEKEMVGLSNVSDSHKRSQTSPTVEKEKQNNVQPSETVSTMEEKEFSGNGSFEKDENSNKSKNRKLGSSDKELTDNLPNEAVNFQTASSHIDDFQNNHTHDEALREEETHSCHTLSPLKGIETSRRKSFEKAKDISASGIKRKATHINELCSKLLQNASQSSLEKENSSEPPATGTVHLHKLPLKKLLSKTCGESPNKQRSERMKNLTSETTKKLLIEPEFSQAPNPVIFGGNKSNHVQVETSRKSAEICLASGNPDIVQVNVSRNSNSVSKSIPNVHKRTLPPPKKRIRPVPVASPRDGSFSPFSPFSSPIHSPGLDFTLKTKEVSSTSLSKVGTNVMKTSLEVDAVKSPIPTRVGRRTGKLKAMMEFHENTLLDCDKKSITNPDNRCLDLSKVGKTHADEALSETKPIQSPIPVVVEKRSGKLKAMMDYFKTPLPHPDNDLSTNSTFLLSLNLTEIETDNVKALPETESDKSSNKLGVERNCSSGKPKAMNEFYKSTLADHVSDLPISPDPLSSSSCTLDAPVSNKILSQDSSCHISINEKNSSGLQNISPEKETSPVFHNITSEKGNSSVLQSITSEQTELQCVIREKDNCPNLQNTASAKEDNSVLQSVTSEEEHSSVLQNITSANENNSVLQSVASEKGKSSVVQSVTSEKGNSSVLQNITSEKEDSVKASRKRKLSTTTDESSDEEGLIRSPSKPVPVAKNQSLTVLPSSKSQLEDECLSSKEKGMILSPPKNRSPELRYNPSSAVLRKKRKLSQDNSSLLQSFSNERTPEEGECSLSNHSFKYPSQSNEESKQLRMSPVRAPLPSSKYKPKSVLKKSALNPAIPAGVKIPPKWSNSTINNYSTSIGSHPSRVGNSKESENINTYKGPRRSRPNIKVVGFQTPEKRRPSFKKEPSVDQAYSRSWKPRNPRYKTLYSERAAHKLEMERRKSSCKQSPPKSDRSSAVHRKIEKQSIGDRYLYKYDESSFSKENSSKNYDRDKSELHDKSLEHNTSDKSSLMGERTLKDDEKGSTVSMHSNDKPHPEDSHQKPISEKLSTVELIYPKFGKDIISVKHGHSDVNSDNVDTEMIDVSKKYLPLADNLVEQRQQEQNSVNYPNKCNQRVQVIMPEKHISAQKMPVVDSKFKTCESADILSNKYTRKSESSISTVQESNKNFNHQSISNTSSSDKPLNFPKTCTTLTTSPGKATNCKKKKSLNSDISKNLSKEKSVKNSCTNSRRSIDKVSVDTDSELTFVPERGASSKEKPKKDTRLEKVVSSNNTDTDKDMEPISAPLRRISVTEKSVDPTKKTELENSISSSATLSLESGVLVGLVEFQSNDPEQSKNVSEKDCNLNAVDELGEAPVSPDRTSTDQTELDQAVAFLTHNEPASESQGPVSFPSQNQTCSSEAKRDSPATSSMSATPQQLSEAAEPGPAKEINLDAVLNLVQQFGLANILEKLKERNLKS